MEDTNEISDWEDDAFRLDVDTDKFWDWKDDAFRLDVDTDKFWDWKDDAFRLDVDTNKIWDWKDDACRLDVESPLGISHSFWDDFSQSGSNVATLLGSTPVSDTISEKDDPSWYEENQSLKRRRVLDFSAGETSYSSYDLHLDNAPQKLQNYSDSFIESPKNFQMYYSSSSSSMLSAGTDAFHGSLDATEHSAESWMRNYSHHKEDESTDDQLKGGDPMAAPLPDAGKKPPRKMIYKLASEVAYPFTHNVTLNDINQRIMMPPSTLVPHASADVANDVSEAESLSSSLTYTASTAPSGKSIISLTRIHTQGKGTITIMRTKN